VSRLNEDLSAPSPDFDVAMGAAAGVEGWLTAAQGRRLFERARESRRIAEIGSFRGRSAILLALGAPEDALVTAIDPHAGNDRGPREIHGSAAQGEADLRAFRSNLERAGVARRVRHVRLPSQDALGELSGELDLLFVDGAHRYRPARDDLARWGERVRPGGHMLVHDAFSSVGVTLAIGRELLAGGRFRYLGRSGSLAEYRREDLTAGQRLRNAARQLAELPWFARNLAIKLAIVLRLRPLAQLLGHRDGPWPY
jgi:SAM-dependent methyltransferase